MADLVNGYDWPVILRVMVGSQAHGLADETSDTDYKEVFVIPTARLLAVGKKPKDAWADMTHIDDEGGWEIGKLLDLAMHGRPNAIEVFYAPWVLSDEEPRPNFDYRPGYESAIRDLAPLIFPIEGFVAGSLGYGNNCRKKLLAGDRRKKWASTYLRGLVASRQMLETGVMPVHIGDFLRTEDLDKVTYARTGLLSNGEVIDYGDRLEREIKVLGVESDKLPQYPDVDRINDLLIQIRRDFF